MDLIKKGLIVNGSLFWIIMICCISKETSVISKPGYIADTTIMNLVIVRSWLKCLFLRIVLPLMISVWYSR